MKMFVVLLLAGVTAALTLVIRIPIPGTEGYLNMGDIGVVFSGLFLRGKWGAIAGGVGSAAADLVGGFFIFAPVTLLAKGIEGFIAGTLGKRNYAWISLAVGSMVAVYFVAEIFMPGIGLAAALSELPFNIIQATVGGLGGISVYKAVKIALPQTEEV